MPEIFSKNCKINVIEYGEGTGKDPFLDNLKNKIAVILKVFTLKKP